MREKQPELKDREDREPDGRRGAGRKPRSNAAQAAQPQPPQLVESRIVGTINHINDRTVFVLENGERWKVADGQVRSFAPLTNPPIFIVKDFFSYKMALPGAGIIRVQKL